MSKVKTTNNKNTSKFKFDSEFSFENRLAEAQRIKAKYPDRIPVIVEPGSSCKLTIDKSKYLVPRDLTMGQFLFVVRKRLKLPAESALFLFINGMIPASGAMLNMVYEHNMAQDEYLKIHFTEENTFGTF